MAIDELIKKYEKLMSAFKRNLDTVVKRHNLGQFSYNNEIKYYENLIKFSENVIADLKALKGGG